jgi:hypothetical protein
MWENDIPYGDKLNIVTCPKCFTSYIVNERCSFCDKKESNEDNMYEKNRYRDTRWGDSSRFKDYYYKNNGCVKYSDWHTNVCDEISLEDLEESGTVRRYLLIG